MDDPLRESGPHLAALIRTHLPADGPLYRRVADALKLAIDAGEVPFGTVLPPERGLATELAVSRSTVVSAYDRLKAEGWLESRQGSGTWVRRPDVGPEPVDDPTSASRLLLEGDEDEFGGHRPATPSSDVIEFAVAAVSGDAAVVDAVLGLDRTDVEALTATHGYLPSGLRPLRRAVARRFTERGLPTGEDQVLVTSGAHQGIGLIARATLHPGDTVLVESPTFPGALDIFRSLGARMVPVPVDDGGARTDVLADLVSRTSPALIYLVPTHQNPTGTVMDATRRAEVARIAARSRVPVLEDLSLVDTGLTDEDPPPPIAAVDPHALIYAVGSMSKLFWGGLRVGWVRAPETTIARLVRSKAVADLGGALLPQLVATALLERVDEVRACRRAELVPRLDLMCRLLAERLPSWHFQRPRGGLTLWCHLPDGNAEEFAGLALRHGVAVVPGPVLSVDEGNRRALRLTFAHDPDTIDAGIARLADAWATYAPAGPGRPSSRLLV